MTAQTIRHTAARAFAERGYDGVTIREIAVGAGVDAALVHHYFGTKRALFETALELPAIVKGRFERTLSTESGTGERLVRAFLDRWDAAAGGDTLPALLRAAGSDAASAALVDELIDRTIVAPATSGIDATRGMPTLRAQLAGAQLLGLAWLRYVLRLEPLASASSKIVAKTLGPSLDATLAGRDYGPRL